MSGDQNSVRRKCSLYCEHILKGKKRPNFAYSSPYTSNSVSMSDFSHNITLKITFIFYSSFICDLAGAADEKLALS